MCIKASQSYFYDRKLQKFSPTAFPMIYVGCRAPSTIFDQYGGGHLHTTGLQDFNHCTQLFLAESDGGIVSNKDDFPSPLWVIHRSCVALDRRRALPIGVVSDVGSQALRHTGLVITALQAVFLILLWFHLSSTKVTAQRVAASPRDYGHDILIKHTGAADYTTQESKINHCQGIRITQAWMAEGAQSGRDELPYAGLSFFVLRTSLFFFV